MNLGAVTLVGAVTITAGDDVLTRAAHGLAEGDIVMFDNVAGGVIGVLEADTKYYVRNPTTDDFQVSGSRGGPVLDFALGGAADAYRAFPSYSAQDMRRIQSGLLQRGDATGGFAARPGVFPNATTTQHVTVAGTTWTVAALVAVVNHSTAGPYIVAYPGGSGTLNPADATNPRIDALDLQVRDDDEDASGFRDSRLVYVTGTPASSPSAPTTTANSERLGTILVPAGGSPAPSIATRPRFTVARGGVVPAENAAAYPGSGGRYEGQLVWDSELDALVVNLNAGSTWGTIASANGYQFRARVIFTSSGSFTKATYPGLRAVRVACQAGGGGGGSAAATAAGEASASGGGGGGEYSEKWVLAASLGTSETVTVGAGGAGGTSGGNGTNGGNTLFGTHCTAIGGDGGFTRSATTSWNAATGGQGGTGGTGDLKVRGSGGTAGFAGVLGGTEGGIPGAGGGSRLGGASRAGRGASGSTGDAGSAYGGGGSGAVNSASQSARAGAAGAAGIVIVDLYV